MALEKIGRYIVKSEISRTWLATVYRAEDLKENRTVAIKVINPENLIDPAVRDRYQRIYQVLTVMQIPGIVPVYEFGEDDERPYIVMKYMPGGSLADRIDRNVLTPEEALRIFSLIAPALNVLHQAGITHGDLKPSNILFDEQGEASLVDFGMILFAEASSSLKEGALVGPPAYISPEQAQGKRDETGRSDIYMLGAILYEMLSGTPPYWSSTPLGFAIQALAAPVPEILLVKSDLPPICQAVIQHAMAKQPEDRFKSATAMLRGLKGEEPVPAALSAAQKTLAHRAPAKAQTQVSRRNRALPTVPALKRAGKPEAVPTAQAALKATLASSGPAGLQKPAAVQVKRRGRKGTCLLISLLVALIMAGAGIFYIFIRPDDIKQVTTVLATQISSFQVAQVKAPQATIPLRTRVDNSQAPITTLTPTIGDAAVSVPASPTPTLTPADPTQVAAALTELANAFTGVTILATPTPTTAPPAPTQPKTVIATPSAPTTYTLQYNDTLFTIAAKFHVALPDLIGVNNATCNSPLPPGRQWTIPPSPIEYAPMVGPKITTYNASQVELYSILDCISSIRALAFSPDQKILAAASGPEVFLWETNTWKPLARLKGHQAMVNSIAFAPDSQTIATVSDDATLRIWDASEGSQLKLLGRHDGPVTGVAYAPDGQRLATSSTDNSVWIWGADGTPIKRISGYAAYSVAFSPDGKYLAVGYTDSVGLYNTSDISLAASFPASNVAMHLAFSPDSSLLASNSDLWQIIEGKHLYTFKSQSNDSVAFSPDGQILAVGEMFTKITNGALIQTFKSPVPVSEKFKYDYDSSIFSPNGDLFVWGNKDGLFIYNLKEGTSAGGSPLEQYTVKVGDTLYNIAFALKVYLSSLLKENEMQCSSPAFAGQLLLIPSGNNASLPDLPAASPITADNIAKIAPGPAFATNCSLDVGKISIASDGQSMVSGSAMFNIPSGAMLIQAQNIPKNTAGNLETQSPSQLLNLSPDGKILAIRNGAQVDLWDTSTGRLIRTLKGHTGNVTSVAFSPNSQMVATGTGADEQNAILWNVADGTIIRQIQGYAFQNMTITANGNYLVAKGDDAVRFFQIDTGRLLNEPLTGVADSYDFSPDGTKMAFASCRERVVGSCVSYLVSIYVIEEGNVIRSLMGMTEQIQDVKFSPDGKVLGASSDNGITLWDTNDWSVLKRLYFNGTHSPFRELYFTPDSKILLSMNEENVLGIWQVSDGKLLKQNTLGRIDSLAFTPDGKYMAVLSNNNLNLWYVKP